MAITAYCRNAYLFSADTPYKEITIKAGSLNLSLDVPMVHYPRGLKWPSFRSSHSAFVDGKCIETYKSTPFEWFYQPQWLRELPPGTERWARYQRYIKELKRELATYLPFKADSTGNLRCDDAWVTIPSRAEMLEILGLGDSIEPAF